MEESRTEKINDMSFRTVEQIQCLPSLALASAKALIDHVENRRLLESSEAGTEFLVTDLGLRVTMKQISCVAEYMQTAIEFLPSDDQRAQIRKIRQHHKK